MKTVLVLVHDDPGQEARLQAAIDIARSIGGHLTCLEVAGPPAQGGRVRGDGGFALIEEEWKTHSIVRERSSLRLRNGEVSWSIRETEGSIVDCIQSAAGLSDLIVLSAMIEGGEPDMRAIATDVLIKTRKPVLIVPQHCRGIDLGGTAIVAWDGSDPVMASLTAAVPLLKLARTVRLIEIQGTSHGSVRAAATYLARHGIEAEVDLVAVFKDAVNDIGKVIEELSGQARAAYCVMGAYGHSPLREALFGGVTRRMLTSSRIPLLLAH
jgi:nucleotide-binding universal stress UspA family protein